VMAAAGSMPAEEAAPVPARATEEVAR
jgi:hypothetical protein